MYTESWNVTGGKCTQGNDGNLSLHDASKKLAWKEHYEQLLNIEFPWSHNILKSLRCMKNEKAVGPSGVERSLMFAAKSLQI